MCQSTVETSEFLDAVGSFGDRANGCLVQRHLDLFDELGQFADGSDNAPTPQTLEAAVAIGGEVTLDCRSAHARNLACLQSSEPRIYRPQHEHFLSHVQIWMRVTLHRDDGLLGLRQKDRDACHP